MYILETKTLNYIHMDSIGVEGTRLINKKLTNVNL